MRRCKEWEMAKGMSKKERKLREEIAELEQKKTRGFMQTQAASSSSCCS